MAVDRRRAVPRTFYLNEAHELASSEKEGGGRLPAYAPVPWASKAKRLTQTLQRVEQLIVASNDPLKNDRFFVLANPVIELEKISKDKKKAPHGTFKEPTEFGGPHGRVFERLGMDLLQVTDAGQAIVHAKKATMQQLRDRAVSLETLGAREQSRWITIDSFEPIFEGLPKTTFQYKQFTRLCIQSLPGGPGQHQLWLRPDHSRGLSRWMRSNFPASRFSTWVYQLITADFGNISVGNSFR
jgi:hypothetical protein